MRCPRRRKSCATCWRQPRGDSSPCIAFGERDDDDPIGIKSLFVLMIILSAVLAVWILSWNRIFRIEWDRRIEARIRELPAKRPAEVPLGQWEFMVGWTMNLHANCGAYDWKHRGRRWQFLEDFERRLQGPVEVATIDWIWDEYVRNAKGGQL